MVTSPDKYFSLQTAIALSSVNSPYSVLPLRNLTVIGPPGLVAAGLRIITIATRAGGQMRSHAPLPLSSRRPREASLRAELCAEAPERVQPFRHQPFLIAIVHFLAHGHQHR